MNAETLLTLYKQAFTGAEDVATEGQGNKYLVRIVDASFEGKRPVARQQAVYAVVKEHIASGVVHALTIKAYTPEEWRKASLFGI